MLLSRRLRQDSQLQQASNNAPALKRGATGTGVAELQDVLFDLKLTLTVSFQKKGRADGIFGAETEKAVRDFQKGQKLTADGVAGAKTLARLDEIVRADKTLEIPDPRLRELTDRADQVRPLEKRARSHW